MKYILRTVVILILLGHCFSCDKSVQNWKSRAIREPGNYLNKKTGLLLKVQVENSLVKYTLINDTGEQVLKQQRDFSDLHNWALYLDRKNSLWILSSDIGYALWRKDSTTNTYEYTEFDHFLARKEVPMELADALPEFFD